MTERAEYTALDPLEMLLDAARYAEGNGGKDSNLEWAKAARAAVAKARLVAQDHGGADAVVKLKRLLTAAKILQQNAVACATNHYGHDCELNGLPGWLNDTQKDIEASEAALSHVDEYYLDPDLTQGQSGLNTFAEMVKAAADTAASDCDKQGER